MKYSYSKLDFIEWLPILIGLLVLYIPTFYNLSNGLWTKVEQAHGPIIFLLSTWLILRRWKVMLSANSNEISSQFGWIILLLALIFYIIGRSQQILVLEISSLILTLSAILLIKKGYSALKVMWFPLFFLF